MNEDVFAALAAAEGKSIDSDIQEITEQIHRLLLQVRKLSHCGKKQINGSEFT